MSFALLCLLCYALLCFACCAILCVAVLCLAFAFAPLWEHPTCMCQLAVQLGTSSNCCAAVATFFMCKLPWLSSRAASSAQCVLKAESSPRVDSKNLLTYSKVILCTVTSESRSRSNNKSASLSQVVLNLRKSEELVADSCSILAGCATLLNEQSSSKRQL